MSQFALLPWPKTKRARVGGAEQRLIHMSTNISARTFVDWLALVGLVWADDSVLRPIRSHRKSEDVLFGLVL